MLTLPFARTVWPLLGLLAAALLSRAAYAQPTPTDPLIGTSWVRQADAPTNPGVLPQTLSFGTDGRVSGSGGCNRFGGPYTVNEGAVRIPQVISTRRACPALEAESAYFSALQAATRYALDGNTLTLTTDDGATLVFMRARTLADGPWALVSYGDPASPTQALADNAPTLAYGPADGSISGTGGCNMYSGSANVNADTGTITVGAVAATERACLDENVSAQESAFFAALGSAASIIIEGDTLLIITADGEELLFARVLGLADGPWLLTEYGVADDLTPVALGSEVTLNVDVAAGRISGSGGCNSYGGGAEVDEAEGTLSVGMVNSTLRACLDDALMQQESAFFALLGAVTSYTLDGDTLTLTTNDGQLLRFVRQGVLPPTQEA